MKMRNATEDDIENILTLIIQDNLQRTENSNADARLFTPRADHEFIKKAIQSNDAYTIIFEGQNSTQIIGFLIAYHKNFLSSSDFKDDQIIQHLLKTIHYDFVYIDAIIVEKSLQGKQYDRMLMMSFLDDSKKYTIITALPRSAHKNPDSLKLLTGFRFQKDAEVTVYNGLTFTIFELDN